MATEAGPGLAAEYAPGPRVLGKAQPTPRQMCGGEYPPLLKLRGECALGPKERSGQPMIRVGKRAAGRLLDGRIRDEMPAVSRAG
jgi:hypothetical protein